MWRLECSLLRSTVASVTGCLLFSLFRSFSLPLQLDCSVSFPPALQTQRTSRYHVYRRERHRFPCLCRIFIRRCDTISLTPRFLSFFLLASFRVVFSPSVSLAWMRTVGMLALDGETSSLKFNVGRVTKVDNQQMVQVLGRNANRSQCLKQS